MLSQADKIKLYVFTFLIDIYFLCIYNLVEIYLYKVFIQLIFLTHILFYIGLYYNLRKLLDIIHYLVIIYPAITIFINDYWIKFNSLIVITIIQLLWIFEGRCILNEKDQSLFYGHLINIFVIFLGLYLSFQLGLIYI